MMRLPRSRIRSLLDDHPSKRDIYRFFREIRSAHRRSLIFESIIESLFVAMVAFSIGRFFLLEWYFMLPFPALYFVVRLIRIARIDPLPAAERIFPSFREQFITIRDNFGKTHEMEAALEDDVLVRSHEIEASGFFDPRRFSTKIIALILLFFVSGFTSHFTYLDVVPFWHGFDESEEDVPEPYDPNFWFWQRSAVSGMDESGDIDSIDLIYGDEAELLAGLDTLPIELLAGREALGLSGRDESRSLTERYEPAGIDAVGAEYFEQSIPLSKHEIVRNYFRDR